MQAAMRAASLLESGTADRVLGWRRGDFYSEVTPSVFSSADDVKANFVFNGFCGANLSKYLIAESRKAGKIAVFLKPCDSYSLVQLIKEHRVLRENVYIVGVQCGGMLDAEKMGFPENEENPVMLEKCRHCKSKKIVVFDELIGEQGAESPDSGRFAGVERLEQMTAEERFAFWQNELSRCIRCNACRNVCPACSCEKCVFDNPASGAQNKAAANSFEESMFHIIRAFHVASRCTDCGECSRVCPQHIPLHLLNRKIIKDINELYGDYQAGADFDTRPPLLAFDRGDCEPSVIAQRGGQRK